THAHSLTHSPTLSVPTSHLSINLSLTHARPHTHSLTVSHTYSLTHSHTHSLTHSLTYSLRHTHKTQHIQYVGSLATTLNKKISNTDVSDKHKTLHTKGPKHNKTHLEAYNCTNTARDTNTHN